METCPAAREICMNLKGESLKLKHVIFEKGSTKLTDVRSMILERVCFAEGARRRQRFADDPEDDIITGPLLYQVLSPRLDVSIIKSRVEEAFRSSRVAAVSTSAPPHPVPTCEHYVVPKARACGCAWTGRHKSSCPLSST